MDFKFPFVEIPKGTGLCLDIGCGSGSARKAIEDAGYIWVGVDIDTSRGIARLIEGDACALPFNSNTFDLIWMNCVLEHVQNPFLALEEMHRVLKIEGTLIGISGYLDPDSTHYCALTHLGLRKCLNNAGFLKCEIRPATSAFPVILRKYLMCLICYERKWITRVAFVLCKLLFGFLEISIFLLGLQRNILSCRSVTSYRNRFIDKIKEIDLHFAAYLVFRCWK